MSSKGNRIINVISNRNDASIKTANLLIEKLSARGFYVPKNYDTNAELNICIGGDGAFLRTVHRYNFPNIPFVGINTGHLGFYQEILPKDIDGFIEKYVKGYYTIEKIFLVKADVHTRDNSFQLLGVNEIVIKGIKSKVVHLEVFINDNHLEKFSGDGIIVATPAGSTGYNFSSGGSIIYPSLKALQITPLSPISSRVYRSLLNSIIIPGDIPITIEPEFLYENSILIVVDGVEFKYKNINKISYSISEKTISRLNFDKNMYWNNLKSKFL